MRLTDDLDQRLLHRSALGHDEMSARTARVSRARLRQPLPGEEDVDQHHDRGDEPGCLAAEVESRRADEGTNHNARAGRSRQPAERLGALFGLHRVRHVRLCDPRRAASQPLHDSRSKQHPQTRREAEDHVGERRCAQANEHRRPAAVAIRELPPDRRRDQLRNSERRNQRAHQPLRSLEVQRVEGHQRCDEHQAHHVDETDGHQHPQSLHRLAPTPSTTALTIMSTTPNAAATPVSESRRLERISMDTGRVSYV